MEQDLVVRILPVIGVRMLAVLQFVLYFGVRHQSLPIWIASSAIGRKNIIPATTFSKLQALLEPRVADRHQRPLTQPRPEEQPESGQLATTQARSIQWSENPLVEARA